MLDTVRVALPVLFTINDCTLLSPTLTVPKEIDDGVREIAAAPDPDPVTDRLDGLPLAL